MRKEINWFAGENGISIEEQETYLAYVKDATILELGGCYGGDYTYLEQAAQAYKRLKIPKECDRRNFYGKKQTKRSF